MATRWKRIIGRVCDCGWKKLLWLGILCAATAAVFIGWQLLSDDWGFCLDYDRYVDTPAHAESVEEAFREVREKCVDDEYRLYDQSEWVFQGIYDYIVPGSVSAHRTNIPGKEYSAYLKGRYGDDRSAEEMTRRMQWLRSRVADWYFEEELPCYYMWDGEKYTAEKGANASVCRRLSGGDPGSEILIGFTAEMISAGQSRLERVKKSQKIGCAVMAIAVLAIGSVVLLLLSDLVIHFEERKRAGKKAVRAAVNTVVNFVCGIVKRVTGEAYYGFGFEECSRRRSCFTAVLIAIVIAVASAAVWVDAWLFFWDADAVLILGMIFGAAGVCLLFYIFRAYWQGTRRIFGEYRRLMDQLNQIYCGRYQDHDMLAETSVFARESQKMSMLGCQMQEHVRSMVRAEKMKIDLISNVSHDLKTPLTSIVSYIDLLSREELTPAAADYVKVLERKSDRLRKTIADVFDLAKASSGNMKVRSDEVNLNRLLVQMLADMEQEIERAPVKLAVDIAAPSGILRSDGDKLYRIFQNILENALKYSMGGTRVFVTLTVENREAVVQVKNVSGYEMNFTEEEVLGRFFRGDPARSSEGSGLGLAIAKEFAELCGGQLRVEVDGDVFLASVRFACCNVIYAD